MTGSVSALGNSIQPVVSRPPEDNTRFHPVRKTETSDAIGLEVDVCPGLGGRYTIAERALASGRQTADEHSRGTNHVRSEATLLVRLLRIWTEERGQRAVVGRLGLARACVVSAGRAPSRDRPVPPSWRRRPGRPRRPRIAASLCFHSQFPCQV